MIHRVDISVPGQVVSLSSCGAGLCGDGCLKWPAGHEVCNDYESNPTQEVEMHELVLLDDDRRHFLSLQRICEGADIHVHRARDCAEAVRLVREQDVQLVVVSDALSNVQGYGVSNSVDPIPTVVCSQALTSKIVFDAIAAGAYDCVAKPVELEALRGVLSRLDQEAAESDVAEPVSDFAPDLSDVIVGGSTEMIGAYRTAAAAATTGATILVRGESGTGKELLAKAIHDASGRTGAFVALNCAAIVDTLAESELFGHEKGAFTGATDRRPGAFETANKGTLFLDEIGDATPSFQAKLLRALDRGEFYRVGGRRPIRPDVRIVAATNQDLETSVKAESFRADLFYRLCEVTIRLPPLRDRLGDIPILSRGLIQRIAGRLGYPEPRISPKALARLSEYDWPGNVRELQNVLTRAMILTKGSGIIASVLAGIDGHEVVGSHALIDVEKQRVTRALEASGWHRGRACDILGITRPTLRRKMREFGLERIRSGRTLRD
jgi:DNA-binding NtrC family response regulator